MRTEREMTDLILDFAKRDERIRAVAMNGSRTNPNVKKDHFQDYDIVYLVTEMDSFIRDRSWIDFFGERVIMQTPEAMTLFPPELGGRFTYLMQFTDGNRIDLMLAPIEEKEQYCREDKLTVILLDKDKSLPLLPPPSDEDYHVKEPKREMFEDCCNEFFWVSVYVAKGLCRREILYAKEHLDRYVRPMLIKMLEWYAGIGTKFSKSMGKCGKYLDQYLPSEKWNLLLLTYSDADYENTWASLFTAISLFHDTANEVAEHFGFRYPHEDNDKVTQYIKSMKTGYFDKKYFSVYKKGD